MEPAFTYHHDFLSAPSCCKSLINHFHKTVISIKAITSTIKTYQYQENGLFDAYLMNNLIFDNHPLLKDMTCLNLRINKKNLLIMFLSVYKIQKRTVTLNIVQNSTYFDFAK